MRITWLISSPVTVERGEWYSPLASVRYRVLPAARYLRGEGHQVHFVRLDEHGPPELFDQRLRADAVIISKVLQDGSLEIAERAKRLGARLIVDLCDDHFESRELGPAYALLCGIADRIVASTNAMAEIILQRTGRTAIVIDDPFEGPSGEPRFAPAAERIRLAWFGHPVNFDTIVSMMPSLVRLSQTQPLMLHVVSASGTGNIEAFLADVQRQNGPGLCTRFTSWSPEATWQALSECDLVVVPSLPDVKKLVKSPNRVVEPLRAGRFAVAYPLPSYQDLSEFLWLGKDMAAGIEWAIANQAAVLKRVQAGQEYINRRFAPQTVALRWSAALEQLVESDRQVA
jgi:hypothetical protein